MAKVTQPKSERQCHTAFVPWLTSHSLHLTIHVQSLTLWMAHSTPHSNKALMVWYCLTPGYLTFLGAKTLLLFRSVYLKTGIGRCLDFSKCKRMFLFKPDMSTDFLTGSGAELSALSPTNWESTSGGDNCGFYCIMVMSGMLISSPSLSVSFVSSWGLVLI